MASCVFPSRGRHHHSVIHRDLKSENCLVRVSGQAVVADFGLARVMEGEVLVPTHTAELCTGENLEAPKSAADAVTRLSRLATPLISIITTTGAGLRRQTMAMAGNTAAASNAMRPRAMTIVGTPCMSVGAAPNRI